MKNNYIYSENFKSLVELANKNSAKFYGGKIPSFEQFISVDYKRQANPYYIGFGNPNSSVLILGKEKGFNAENNYDQNWRESVANPQEWNNLMLETIFNREHISYPNHDTKYINAHYPYSHKMKSGHTWSKYQKLINLLYPDNSYSHSNSFLSNSFITEINHVPSKYSKNIEILQERKDFLKHKYYQSFPIVILACADYLKPIDIEEIFNVTQFEDLSQPGQKLIVYKGQDKILINTRQLSMNIKPELFDRINNQIKNYLPAN